MIFAYQVGLLFIIYAIIWELKAGAHVRNVVSLLKNFHFILSAS